MTDVESFRLTVRAWLAESGEKFAGSAASNPRASQAFRTARSGNAGLLGLTLDPAYGGRGLSKEHQKAFNEEVSLYALPPIGEVVTTGICAPTLLDFGTEEQKRRHVPRMIRGEEVWTQLLSEPSAGSDLAGLQTRRRVTEPSTPSAARRCGRQVPVNPTLLSAWPALILTSPSIKDCQCSSWISGRRA